MSRHSIQPYTHILKIFQPKRRYPAAAPRSESPHVPPPSAATARRGAPPRAPRRTRAHWGRPGKCLVNNGESMV